MKPLRPLAAALVAAVTLAATSGGCATGLIDIPDPVDSGTPTPTPDAACTKCGADCVDLKGDSANCGACGKACSSGAKCVQGTCQCNAGATTCAGQCVDTKVDAKNCGMCGVVCGGGDGGVVQGGGTYGCANGTCGIICPMGKMECSGACVDTQTDAQHCGMCGKACMMGESCSKGVCCKAGETACGGVCVNLQTDPKNCSACGMACPMQTPACVMGVCKASSCGNAAIDMGERCDGTLGVPAGGQITCRAPGAQNECKWDFSAVPQLYCNGSCTWGGAQGCDQADADIFCKLKTGKSTSTATAFTTGTALGVPGFSCPSGSYGTNLGQIPEYGVMVNVWYQGTSILANHGSGTVITSVTCN